MHATRLLTGLMLAGVLSHAAAADGIYTCVDKQGRRLTADRPIIDCIDREQKQITPTGTVIRRIGPSLTADERAAEEERQRKEAEERSRIADEKRRDRALLTRYPDKATHESERAAALDTIDAVIASATRRITDLGNERKRLDGELEFYKGDLSKAPPKLKRQYDEIDQQVDVQKRFIANQELEKKRVSARYDEELGRLKQLWAMRAQPAGETAAKR